MMILFTEVQKFKQVWLWFSLMIVTLIPIYGFYRQIFLGLPFGDKPISDIGIIVFLIAMISLLLFFWMMKLKTEITDEHISVCFSPFFKTTYLWTEIACAEIVDYGFVGYGIRLGTKYGTVYNTSGSKGLAIQLEGGRKICIGTQKETELQKIVTSIIQNKNR